MNSQVGVLLWKEFRQLPRKRGAVATAVIFPFLFFLVLPIANMLALAYAPGPAVPVGVGLPPGLASFGDDPAAMVRNLTMPLFVAIAGLMLPSVMAIYTIVAERERRTLELLVALPVSVGSIVFAKLAAVLAVATAIAIPLFAIDSALLLALDLATPVDILALLWLLLTALAYSTASALTTGLLARDYRTANNLSGALFGPLILVSMAFLVLLPAGVAALALGTLFLVLTAVSLTVALRWLTFERLLG